MALYDRHETLAGVSGANPLLIPRNLAANAINRSFRYDRNTNRNPFRTIELNFQSDAERVWFQAGNVQGAYFYNSYPSFQKPYLIVSIAGRIFKIEIKGRYGNVTTLFEGNDPVLTHAWFAQGFEWLVIQNGYNPPILWDGATARRAAEDEVPVGGPMAFIHGRLVVSSADGTNQIAVGDIVYGEDQTTTSDIIRFTEIQYWAEGGAFGAPIFIGDIMGMATMPYLDTGTGQNELVILGTEGAVSLDLSKPRELWPDTQLLRISLIGGGCVSSHSLTTLNGDLFFRSAEGIRSYRNARAEFSQSWKQSPISSDVRRWIDTDAPDLLQYNSQASWNNFLFSTCRPCTEGPNNQYAGFHRFHKGFVVMDAQPESNTLRSGAPIWYGMWTGIRPICFVDGRIENAHRCFAFSYDRDGRNRLYEITQEGFDSFEGERRKMFSMYDTGALGTIERTTDFFQLKTVQGGELELSNLAESVEVELAVRPDNSPCFVDHFSHQVGCDCEDLKPSSCHSVSLPSQARIIFGGLGKKCDPSTGKEIAWVHHWQARAKFTGNVAVEGLAYRFITQDNPIACATEGGNCNRIECCPDGDSYTYSLAPEGDNDEIPDIPAPSDAPILYQSTKQFTAYCLPPNYGEPATATGVATSTISQEDADLKAIENAKDLAFTQLRCQICEGGVLVSFTVNNDSVDLSTYFTEIYENYSGRPWRMIDQETMAVYALGVFSSGGSMQITYAQATGDQTFDDETFVFTDTSATLVPVAVQIGCPNGVWGDIDEYNPIT